jgi:uncharacterized protein YaaW (UPF0174 family)
MKNKQRIADQLHKYMLESFEENKHKGCQQKDSLLDLFDDLKEEVEKLKDGAFYLECGHDSVRENTLKKCGDTANIVAEILDKLLDQKGGEPMLSS